MTKAEKMVDLTTNPIAEEARRSFFQHIIGPRGGLFALGMFLGMFTMHVYMSKYVLTAQKEAFEMQIATLTARVESVEATNKALNQKLQTIAFKKIDEE